MKYDEEIKREIELESDDLVALFDRRESVDGGTRVFIRPTEMLRALGRLDPIPPGERTLNFERIKSIDHIETEEVTEVLEA